MKKHNITPGGDVRRNEIASDIELNFKEENLLIPKRLKHKMINKFEKGRQEHGDHWHLIEHKSELLNECYDGMNYLEGAKAYNNAYECIAIQKLFINAWQLANKLKPNPRLIRNETTI